MQQGLDWIKKNRRAIIKKFADPEIYRPETEPVTTFMAGTPGAGKTEFSISLLQTFDTPVVRIDADEIRELLPGYNGRNSDEFQSAVTKAINFLYDHTRHKSQSVLLDGTFAYANWRDNIKISIEHDRKVEIYYLYQEPAVAWDFCQKRATAAKGRVVPEDVFIHAYLKSIQNVEEALTEFPEIVVYYAQNDYKSELTKLMINVNTIKGVLPSIYTESELKDILNQTKL